VTYEVGYAIGAQRRVLIVKHAGYRAVDAEIASLGIFDTLGYKEYSNSEELEQLIRSTSDLSPNQIPGGLNATASVYLNFTKNKSDQDSLI
jgi:hypothetical protein